MSNKKNRYLQKANKKQILSALHKGLDTKGNAKNSALETGKDILIGVLGGGIIGAIVGKPSLVLGIVTTAIGHYTGNKFVQVLGIGTMAANGFQKSTTVNGLEGIDGVKERLTAFKTSVSEKFYLDKIMKKKLADAGVTGVGELQYFTYPDNSMTGHLAALDDIEDQITESARQFQGQQGQLSSENEFSGQDDMNERLY